MKRPAMDVLKAELRAAPALVTPFREGGRRRAPYEVPAEKIAQVRQGVITSGAYAMFLQEVLFWWSWRGLQS